MATCKYCKRPGLKWQKDYNRWVLLNPDGTPHNTTCSRHYEGQQEDIAYRKHEAKRPDIDLVGKLLSGIGKNPADCSHIFLAKNSKHETDVALCSRCGMVLWTVPADKDKLETFIHDHIEHCAKLETPGKLGKPPPPRRQFSSRREDRFRGDDSEQDE
jgi:hypothetical protein